MDPSPDCTVAVRAPTPERRKEPRYAPAAEAARIGWWEGRDFRMSDAQLEDISSGGAKLKLADSELWGSDVWLSMGGAGTNAWIPATITELATAEDGSRRLRAAFHNTCPYDVFKSAVWGTPAPPAAPCGVVSSAARDSETVAETLRIATREMPPPRTAPDAIEDVTGCDDTAVVGEPPLSRRRTRPSKLRPVAMVLSWLVPMTICVSLALTIAVLAYVALANPSIVDRLVTCLTFQ